MKKATLFLLGLVIAFLGTFLPIQLSQVDAATITKNATIKPAYHAKHHYRHWKYWKHHKHHKHWNHHRYGKHDH